MQLYGANHFAYAFFCERTMFRINDDVIQTGQTQAFRNRRSAEMTESSYDALPFLKLAGKHAHFATPFFSRHSRMSDTASFRFSMELA